MSESREARNFGNVWLTCMTPARYDRAGSPFRMRGKWITVRSDQNLILGEGEIHEREHPQ
jgi:hypothetical protein